MYEMGNTSTPDVMEYGPIFSIFAANMFDNNKQTINTIAKYKKSSDILLVFFIFVYPFL